MGKKMSDYSATEKLKICQERIDAIAKRLREAMYYDAMCENVLFTDRLLKQIPPSKAVHSFNFWQDSLIRQYALCVSTIWDFSDQKFDQMSLPTIAKFIDEDVLLLAEKIHLVKKPDAHKVNVRSSIKEVLSRMEKFKRYEPVKNIKEFRNLEIAHNLDPKRTKNYDVRKQPVKFSDPHKVLNLSMWCCKNLSLGLLKKDQKLDFHFRCAHENTKELWHNCTFDIPT